jgi:RNA polymerase sigma-70 factor, ECF subfamily
VKIRQSEESPPDAAAGTLGELLYADKTRPRVPEEDWAGLVRSVAAGDQSAFRALYDRTHRLVLTLIMRITHDRQTAEELTLDVFHDIWRRAPRYDAAGGTVLGWIMNQARSRAIDRVRFETRKKRTSMNGHDVVAEADDSDLDDAMDLLTQGHYLRDALSALTQDERQAIEAAYFTGLSYTEVAARLDQPVGTVKTRIRSALAKLRQALAPMERE